MRLLTAEARINAHKFRGGFLNDRDYGRLSQALGALAEARIFIDDTAGIGVLEMRAKARRLKAEHGLHLLVIDYVQLMQGRGRFENRQLEIASISRSLKGLAKELHVPIIALSQLSRAPEARVGPPSAAVGPARERQPRAGRRRRDVHLPRGLLQEEGRGGRRVAEIISASSATGRRAASSWRSSTSSRVSRTSTGGTANRREANAGVRRPRRHRPQLPVPRRVRHRGGTRVPPAGAARDARHQGQRVRARRVARGARARERRRPDAGRGRHRGGRVAPRRGRAPARPRLRRPVGQRSRGHLHPPAHAHRVHAGGGGVAGTGRGRARGAPRLPPEDRHGDEPARVQARQPAAGGLRARRAARTSTWKPPTRTSRPRTTTTRRCSSTSGNGSSRRSRCSASLGIAPETSTPPTAPRCCATSARGSTSCGPACSSTGWCRRRGRRPSTCARRCRCTAGSWR